MLALAGSYIAELLFCVIVIFLIVRFKSYIQPSGIAFVRDDSREEKIADIVTGSDDPNTGLTS